MNNSDQDNDVASTVERTFFSIVRFLFCIGSVLIFVAVLFAGW